MSRSGRAAALAITEPRNSVTALLRPRSIAVVGASETELSFGQRLLRSISTAGFAGAIYPVNPKYETVQGLPCYPSLAAITEPVDLVAFAIAEQRLVEAFAEAAKAGARAAAVFSRGYVPPGAARPTIGERWVAIAREAGMAVCGDNCMGFFNFVDKVRISGNPPPIALDPGPVGLLSHSGSTWSGLLSNQRQIQFNYALSVGRESVTGMADYLQFLLDQPDTRVIGLVLETLRNPEGLMVAFQRALDQGVPIVALTLGRTERGRRFTRTHSGAVAGTDAAYQALCDRFGISRVTTLDEFTDTIEMMRCPRRPPTDTIAVGTDSGGERQLISDIGSDVGVRFADFTPETVAKLTAVLDPGLEAANPVDYWGDGRLYWEDCLKIMAEDANVGTVVMATNMVPGRRILTVAGQNIEATQNHTSKPVVMLGNLHSTIDRDEARRLRALGIPVLMGTHNGLSALKHFIAYHHRPDLADDVPPAAPGPEAVARWRRVLERSGGDGLGPGATMEMLAEFGVPVVPGRLVADATAAVEAAKELGFPVALKTGRGDILHKTDVGGVALGLADADAVAAAYRRLAKAFGPEVQVQAMAEAGTEVLLGMVIDPHLGPIVTVGLGGVFVEIFRDVVAVMPPFGPRRALTALESLKGRPLLEGARGRPAADLRALADAMARFSVLAKVLGPVLGEADVNPVIAGPKGAVAVDALFLGRART